MSKQLDTLRGFFKLSNIAFDFKNSLQETFLGYVTYDKMQSLHRIALKELEKENPNMDNIDALLHAMEITAEINKANSDA